MHAVSFGHAGRFNAISSTQVIRCSAFLIGIDVGLLLSHSCFLACLCFVFTLDCVSDLIEGLLVGDLAGDAELLQAFLADLEEGRAETLVHPRPRLNDLAIIFLLLCYGDIAVSIHLPILANIGKLLRRYSPYCHLNGALPWRFIHSVPADQARVHYTVTELGWNLMGARVVVFFIVEGRSLHGIMMHEVHLSLGTITLSIICSN